MVHLPDLATKRWSAMDAVPSNGHYDLWTTNYIIGSWLPIGWLPRKVCALVVFYIRLLLSCSKPVFD